MKIRKSISIDESLVEMIEKINNRKYSGKMSFSAMLEIYLGESVRKEYEDLFENKPKVIV